ncbi:hypothetical protein [Thalassomonas haliotis]|uniref:Uncharacterized protein n=1 Tax=Thalassomonas haliotis TaxID=485448 RepID=A0ABY7VIG7_9GAMM|nr:hypothetical protein [Thalassomonas haliotis]WDE12728.1 hypothetical protein H3N35_04460 [Thalassomonas haliotis]
MLIHTNINKPAANGEAIEISVKPYHLRFIKAGVSAPIVPDSFKGKKLSTVKARPCSRGYLPRIEKLGQAQYLPVCQSRHCRCPKQPETSSQPSHDLALLEWNKYRRIRSNKDLFHPTVRVKQLPLKEIKLNLSVEQMYIDRFLAKFNRDQLMVDDRRIFVLREKWLEVVRYQLNTLEYQQS